MKQKEYSIGERCKLARTKYNKNGAESPEQIYQATSGDIMPSLLSNLENDKREVGCNKIKILAEHYGVSSDFLLGLSNTPTVKNDEAVITKITGLSFESVQALKLMNKKQNNDVVAMQCIDFLNMVLNQCYEHMQNGKIVPHNIFSFMDEYVRDEDVSSKGKEFISVDSETSDNSLLLSVKVLYKEFVKDQINKSLELLKEKEK